MRRFPPLSIKLLELINLNFFFHQRKFIIECRCPPDRIFVTHPPALLL